MIFPRGAKKISPPAELRSLSLDWDCKGNIFFRFCKIFLNFFEALQFLASSVRPPLYSGLSPLILRSIAILKRTLPPPLSKGTAKVLIISNFPNIFKKFWKKLQNSFYIIPPAGIAGAAGVGSGISTMPHSVVRNIPATDAAFSRATLATLVGSITPASYIWTYWSVRAL